MGKISIIQGIYFMGNTNSNAFKRDGCLHVETREVLSLPERFKKLLSDKGVKFYLKYNSYKDIVYKKFNFTLGEDIDKGIKVISICHPFFDEFDEELSESIVIGRIKRTLGDLKYETNKPIKDKYGEIVLDENKKPILRYRVRYYKPYYLDAKILDKYGKETKKLKYPYIYKKEV